MWLIDLASQISDSAQLDGYELSEKQFPPRPSWPSYITFSKLDAFKDVPERLQHKYDVIRLRFWYCVVRDNDPSQLIRHATSLLRFGNLTQRARKDAY
ncbi:uncharacterized protein N7484_000332 [Penicillium longicatenatum]|uniref:uncharacterized protein n=1 Tax=Penicillium longicatenatum TaxID=1561947 RepID=UPI002549454D|nr:uncharacterized protein N7484_000332 [Penicillium longicatenatum]KAJ5660960.1 hypothetical protein N7484_000332 [Penicillium longicatenatum]